MNGGVSMSESQTAELPTLKQPEASQNLDQPNTSAGALLQHGRVAKGLTLQQLANMIKVPVHKLQSLESNQLSELPDPAFTRALAKTVCRTLQINADPVLAQLPSPALDSLAHVCQGLNTPYRESSNRWSVTDWPQALNAWGIGLFILLLATLMVYLLPAQVWRIPDGQDLQRLKGIFDGATVALPTVSAPAAGPGTTATTTVTVVPVQVVKAPAAGAAELPASSAITIIAPQTNEVASGALALATTTGMVADAPNTAALTIAAPATTVPAIAGAMLQMKAIQQTWVEVLDARLKVLMSGTLEAGESVSLEGELPLRVKVGNAQGTEVFFKGQPVDLTFTRDNVARLELK
jgi:cytoskeleton protein RodZ